MTLRAAAASWHASLQRLVVYRVGLTLHSAKAQKLQHHQNLELLEGAGVSAILARTHSHIG